MLFRWLRRRSAAATIRRASPFTTLSQLADGCKSTAQIKQVHAHLITADRIRDGFAASRLLNFCALSSTGDLEHALKIFRSIPTPNLFMWNTIIRAHAGSSDDAVRGLVLYVEMRRRGVSPGTHTFPFVLKCCSCLKSAECCRQVHAHVLKYGFDADLHVANGLVRGYSVSCLVGEARKMFDELSERNLSIWTTIICGYAQNGSAEEALKLFDEMIRQGFEPGDVVLSSVLSACAQSACLTLGEKIHDYIKDKRIDLKVILGTALVNMYARNGALTKAKECFDGLKEKITATWNALICGWAVHGHAKEAIMLFETMQKVNTKPNAITLLGILSACSHSGLFDYGIDLFYSMESNYGVKPNVKHYGCMVDLLGREGRVLEAEELIKGMSFKADVVIWGALLSACRESGNIEVAERAVKEILDLEPHNHGVYVVLSNMYAEAGKWDFVIERRKGMVEGKLKKIAGLSLVGIDS